MRLRIALTHDINGWSERKQQAVRRGSMVGARRFRARLKLALRDDVRRAGLGDRVANTWRDELYPSGGKLSMRPTVFAWTKAPEIVRGHTDGVPIRGKSGNWLAIPTENTPRKGRRLATPLEVEGIFNQDLVVFKGRGGQALAFVNVIRAKSGRGFRRATKRRTRDGRDNEMVLMFVMVKQVTLRPKLNWQRIAGDLGRVWRDYIGQEAARALNAS
ncbi:MAG: DUF6441 family protein [Pseudorhodoplanes sp.]|uniref:DUF6441 family protein n=1 Tax=Pseudorhodoplanes sp. TaxID=1934341 RepID=UPI003D0A7A66